MSNKEPRASRSKGAKPGVKVAKKNAADAGRLGGLKGGRARAATLSPQARSDIAREAATARWGGIPKAPYTGTLQIGDMQIPCAVLPDKSRVVSVRGMADALGRARSGAQYAALREDDDGAKTPPFLSGKGLKPFISKELAMELASPRLYRSNKGGKPAHGFRAELIPEICEVWLRARDAGTLRLEALKEVAARADVLMRGLARVGIIALVDEATGYQADRSRDELSKILEAYIAESLRPWLRRFPHEFFKQVHRLWGWEYKEGSLHGPRYIGKIINDYIYKRLPPGVHEELIRNNPAVNGRRKAHHHQWLTDDTGIPHLEKQITAVTTLMAVSDDKPMFDALLRKRFPKTWDQTDLFPTKPRVSED